MVFIAVGEEVLEERRGLPVFRVVALEAFNVSNRHRPIEERVLAVHFFAAAPTRVARQIGLWSPDHQDLAVVLRSLRDETGFVALDGGGLAHQIGVPRLAHPGRLRELRGGDGL